MDQPVTSAGGALILPYKDRAPRIAHDAFVAPGAVVVGDVEIGADVTVGHRVLLEAGAGLTRTARVYVERAREYRAALGGPAR